MELETIALRLISIRLAMRGHSHTRTGERLEWQMGCEWNKWPAPCAAVDWVAPMIKEAKAKSEIKNLAPPLSKD